MQPTWKEDSKFDVSVIGGERSSAVAVLSSLFFPGLGQMYCGQLGRGLLMFFLPLALIYLLIVLWANSSEHLDMNFMALLVVCSSLYQVYVAFDAYRESRNVTGEFSPRPYNKPVYHILYALMVLVLVGSGKQAINRYYVAGYTMPSVSMTPNIQQGDSFLANIASYRHRAPERWDVAVVKGFPASKVAAPIWVGRVVGLPGDRVLVATNGSLIVNGVKEKITTASPPYDQVMPDGFKEQVQEYNINLEEHTPYSIIVGKVDPEKAMKGEVVVPPDHYFLLGDFRSRSQDSRDFGPAPRASLAAEAGSVYYSMGLNEGVRWTRVGSRIY